MTVGPAYAHEDGLNRIGFVAGLALPLWNRNRKAISCAGTDREIARLGAIETWKKLVSGSVETAQLAMPSSSGGAKKAGHFHADGAFHESDEG